MARPFGAVSASVPPTIKLVQRARNDWPDRPHDRLYIGGGGPGPTSRQLIRTSEPLVGNCSWPSLATVTRECEGRKPLPPSPRSRSSVMYSFFGRGSLATRTSLAVGFGVFLVARVAVAALPRSAPDTPPVAGVVKDSSGTPIANVQVVVTALNRVTTTNAGGRFTFRCLPAGSYHLSSLLIGYAPGHADVVVPGAGDSVRVTIVMHQSALQLSGVQVTATPVGTDPRNVTQSATELSGQALAR